jgi:SAM-dependent methyltransferase
MPINRPSPWVERFIPLIPANGPVLDLACGGGRHTRFLLRRGHPVTAVDRDISRLDDIDDDRLERVEIDLEDGRTWPFENRRFAGIVVTNYLHRPLFDRITAALEPAGVLIYETFARGNERFGKPSNPAFLLEPGELLAVAAGATLRVLAYEDLEIVEPKPACVQRLCAIAPG